MLSAFGLACGGLNEEGLLEAQTFGDAPDIPPPNDRWDKALERCAADETSEAPALALTRTSYLQQVQPDGALVLWASMSDKPHDVAVTLPSGEEVLQVESQLDTSGEAETGYQQRVELDGLEPDSVYCYSITDADGATTAPIAFRTAPERGSDAPLSFVVFGDSGHVGVDQAAVFEQIQTVPFDLMLVTGDVAYGSGTLDQFELEFFEPYAPVLRSIPSYPVLGNHDYGTQSGEPYLSVFALPENGAPEGDERWYSFDRGDVHFVGLDTERVGDDAQAQWLQHDLDDNDLPWIVAMAHIGPYSSGHHGSSSTFRSRLSPILEAHGVQLVFTGHDHDYERTTPQNGTTYVVTGGGGRGTRAVGESSFTAFSEQVAHFVYVRIEGDDLRLYAIDGVGQVFDFLHIAHS